MLFWFVVRKVTKCARKLGGREMFVKLIQYLIFIPYLGTEYIILLPKIYAL